MRFYYQVLGLASGETQPSLLLVFDSKKYLFNVGDGIQRLVSEHRFKLSTKLSDIFITALSPDTISGLPGLMLSLMQASEMRRTIHGPPGIAAYVQSACTFIWNQFFDIVEYTNVDYEEKTYHYRLTTQHFFQDSNITVRAFPLGFKHYDFSFLSQDVATFYSPSKQHSINLDTVGLSGMCYVIEGPKVPGKFLAQKALELGVKKGPAFGKLTKGEAVEVDGRWILPEMVVGPSPPISSFAVVHSTSPQGLNMLPDISQYLSPTSVLESIIHLSSGDVLRSQEYQSFAHKHPSAAHLVLNEETSTQALNLNYQQVTQGAAMNLFKLASVCPSLFTSHALPTFCQRSEALSLDFPYHLPQYFLKYVFDTSNSPIKAPAASAHQHSQVSDPTAGVGFDASEVIKPLLYEPLPSIESATAVSLQGPQYNDLVDTSILGSDPYVMFLGTASMKPGKYRNVSGIYLGEWGSGLLLDCGESTYSQMLLHFGWEQMREVLTDLSAILITHMHADHHLGLLKVLEERRKYTRTPVTIIAPSYMQYYLSTCTELFGDLCYQLFPCEAESFSIPGLTHVKSVLVDHCPGAYGFVLKHQSGWSVTYSGDTRPCEALVKAGLGSTLLIHEATLSDDLQEFAIEVKHSTISEAQDVFRRMGAWRLILTHFSQRYAKNCTAEANGWTLHAYDHLKVRLSQCYAAPQWMSACSLVTSEDA
jgi:ribonuclease Z